MNSDCPLSRPITRRRFLALAGAVAATLGAAPAWAARAMAAAERLKKRTLVVLFQRGAADGLNIVPPFGDPHYRRARPSIRVEDTRGKDGALDLDGNFGLHPALEGLMPLWREKRMAIVHAAGSHDPTRSHFDAQDYMESGTPGLKSTPDGWMNRTLGLWSGTSKNPMSAVAIARRLPRALRGEHAALAFPDVERFRKGGRLAASFEEMYEEAVDAVLTGAAHDVAEAARALRGVPSGEGGRSGAAKDLGEVARLVKADLGLRLAFLEMGGWDHHAREGGAEGLLARRLTELGEGVAGFYRDLGDRSEEVLLVAMTEFGRTLQENGNLGTDHGHASAMFLFGGSLRGGRVYGSWPGLSREQLFEGRDLAVTTDFRQVLGEALGGHLGLSDLAGVFPGFTPGPALGLLG